jgi:spore coat polysaccharide biosynthesis protein SpsF (cytidylyltransferase family)
MGSTRLPGKVLMEVNDRPLLAYQLDRISKSKKLDRVVVATSILEKDDAIEAFCKDYGIDCYRGSENDVMSRYYECCKQYNPDTVVRMTADCPLIDPEIIDAVVQKFEDDNVDYCANTVPPETSKFPDGLDIEVFSMNALEMANTEVQDKHRKEHVTFQFWQDEKYVSSQYTQEKDWSEYRITVDYPEDFEVVEYIFKELNSKKKFGSLSEIIGIIENNKEVKEKNSQYFFGQGWDK